MQEYLKRLWTEEDGQDLTEYTMIIVAIVLASISFISQFNTPIKHIWTRGSSTLSNASALLP